MKGDDPNVGAVLERLAANSLPRHIDDTPIEKTRPRSTGRPSKRNRIKFREELRQLENRL